MGKHTLIEWADSTINPTSGCDGCELYQPGAPHKATCYAFHQQTNRLSKTMPALYSRNFSEVRIIPGRMQQAASWSDLRGQFRPATNHGPAKPWFDLFPRIIFVGDLADILSRNVSFAYLHNEVVEVMRSKTGGRHFWMVLTKQPQRLAEFTDIYGPLPDNCMALTSVTSEVTGRIRVPHLMRVKCRWRGLSMEPLRGPVDLESITRGGPLDLVITGGESGPLAHCPHPDWFRSLRDQCVTRGWPFFFKQWGSYSPHEGGEWVVCPSGSTMSRNGFIKSPLAMPEAAAMTRAGKHTSGRLLDGREWSEFPNITAAWSTPPAASPSAHDSDHPQQ